MWILKTPLREISFLYLPGLLAVLAAISFPKLGEESLFYGLLAVGFIDSGHVYTTMWRTWFHREEFVTNKSYIFLPLFFFVIFSCWFYFQIPYLWAFVVYATLYHHSRQVYGFSKWYQTLNRRQDAESDRYLYFFSYFPMVIYHFRSDAIGAYYTKRDLFLYPQTGLRDFFLCFYLMVGMTWVYREWRLWRSGIQETNRILSIAIPGMIYCYCFLLGNTVTQVIFPLLFLHGVAYLGVMEQSLSKTQKRFQKEGIAFFVVFITAFLFGLLDSWVEENFVDTIIEQAPLFNSLVVGLILTPLFSHYSFDAIIWRKNHREAGVIFF
jgi:hypothetical protein